MGAKIKEVKYAKRFNTGQYEHEEYYVVADMDGSDVDEAKEAFEKLKTLVKEAHGAAGNTSTEEDEEPTEKIKKTKGKKKKGNDAESEDESEEKSNQKNTKTSKTNKSGSKKRSKSTVYDRNNEIHKKLFVEFVTKCDPDWRESDKKRKKVKDLSVKMEGEEFLDAEGELVSNFLISVRKAIKGK